MSIFTHFDGMCFPQPGQKLSDIEWQLRYGTPTKEQLMVAASVISAYSGLVLLKTGKQRDYIVKNLRRGAEQRGTE